MQRRTPRSLFALVAPLFVVAIALFVVGAAAASPEVTVADGPTAAGPDTPLLSARRAPAQLAAPVAARRARVELAPVLAQLPPGSCVRAADGATVLADVRSDEGLVPASAQKLAVATAALTELGPEAVFTTEVVAAAPPSGGTVEGDLVLVGGGDPLLTTDPYLPTIRYGTPPHTRLEALADAVVAGGVRRVTGAVRGDEGRYDTVRSVPSWSDSDISGGFVGPLSGLSVNDARAYAALGQNPPTVQPAGDPAAYAASALTDLLRARGVAVDGAPAAGDAPADATVVAEVRSLPVAEIVREMLVWSDNNTAELLVKELGVRRGGEGSTAAGTRAVAEILAEEGIDVGGMVLADGSGLSPENRLPCSTLTDLLAHGGAGLAGLLPLAGEQGTLADRYGDSPAEGKVRAKTGTLRNSGVNALSGWVATDPGAQVPFAFITNGTDVDASRQLSERFTEALLSYPQLPDLEALGP